MNLKDIIIDFLFILDIDSKGVFDDWYWALSHYVLLGLLFGHTLHGLLKKRFGLSYILGFILALFPSILLFFLFHFLEVYLGVASQFFYHGTMFLYFLIAVNRLWKRHKDIEAEVPRKPLYRK